jgi:FkbM family methyltransferase
MPSLRTIAKKLPRGMKRSIQQILFGYHSHAPSFSVAGEDMILRHLLGSDKMDGFFIDVGAYHPVILSNTHFFYVNGWRGINIEARPGSLELFQAVRPRDINLQLGVSRERGEMTYYYIGPDSPMNSFSREFLDQIGMSGAVKQEISIPVLPLAELLAEHLSPGQVIDFMTVDVEGLDLQVLESNDWDAFRPRFVVVEDTAQDAQSSEIVRFMKTRGYDVCAQNVMIMDKINEFFFVDRG